MNVKKALNSTGYIHIGGEIKKLLTILLLSFGFGAVIHVPDDWSTIQSGIDAAMEGDTVLVDEGIYYENLIIQKSITLTSYAIFDDLSEWTVFDADIFFEYQITNEKITNTMINGSNDTNGEDFQSTILINSPEDECISPTIFGFSITGGGGTLHTFVNDEGVEVEERIGGGILSNNALPKINYNYINNNGGNIEDGGGIIMATGVDIGVNIFGIRSNHLRCDGDVDLSYNFYRDNDALYGNTLSTYDFAGSLDMTNSIFDVYNCPEQEVTPVWVDVEEEVEVDFQYSAGDLCSITEDVWVSPDGNDYLNTGTSESSAFRTIKVALELIAPQDDNPVTIFLTEGTFAPSTTGESFPILMISNMNLIGQGEDITIIDAQQTGRVITMEECDNNIISDLTITGGLAEGEYPNYKGGGMYLNSSNPTLTNVTISNNTADYEGGGMHLLYSNPNLTNVTISNNQGGGIHLSYSDPTLTHVTISNNTAIYGGGMSLYHSNPTLTNVTISNNTAYYGGGMYLSNSDPTLTHVTISNNTSTAIGIEGGGMVLGDSNPIMTNSIMWDNSPESIHLYSNEQPLITYSNIEGGWAGEGSINSDPLFTDLENGDYTLMENSPCIDTGDPFIWYNDLDMTRADMGATGGLYATPNFTSHDFGEVGDIGSSKQFNLYNYRNTSITISNITFGTASFTTNTSFPMTIDPLETGIISIDANNTAFGYMEDAMEIISDELPEGLSVSLSVTGSEGNILTGDLSGSYVAATYRITGDLTITDGNTVYLNAGTQFLFDGEYNFNIYGTLKAIGTESDSIIFDSFSDERWRGFTLENASDQTTFEYVRISGAEKDDGGGMFLSASNPILTHVTISNNTAETYGGGMSLYSSNPILTNVTISDNTADYGGGMYLYSSNPTLSHVTISNNTASEGGGMHLFYSNPTLTHVTISNNTAFFGGGGMFLYSNQTASNPTLTHVTISNNTADNGGGMFFSNNLGGYPSNPILTHVTISDNTAETYGGGMYIESSNPTLTHVTISDNTADYEGGGMHLFSSSPILSYVTISNNTASEGGGMYLSNSDPTLTHVTISDNTADYEGGGMHLFSSSPIMTNSIIWDNSPESISGFGEPVIIFNNIEGGWGLGYCVGYNEDCNGLNEEDCLNMIIWGLCDEWVSYDNINYDPLFNNPENGDYTLMEGSPCIDTGIIIEDMEYCGDAPDMGAYEYCVEECGAELADVTGDGQINVLDLVQISYYVLELSTPDYPCAADYNQDGEVNILDLVQIANYILDN